FLDEPTNDLDTQTLNVLESYLEHFPGVVITVSHDRYFLDRVVDRLIVFTGDEEIKNFYGNYSDYLAKEMETVVKHPKPEKKDSREKKRKKLSYLEQKEWESIEDNIMELEEKITVLEQKIADAGSDAEKVQEIYSKLETVEKTLEQKMDRWEELSMLIEEFRDRKSVV